MTPVELAVLLEGGMNVVLDSNAIFSKKILGLADQISRVNELREPEARLHLCVSALAHGEHLAQERRRWGSRFQPDEPRQLLRRKNVAIIAYTEDDAARFAELLATQFPTKEAWKEAKCNRPATVDWFIRAHAEGRDWLLVTDDSGSEFSKMSKRANLATLREVLRQILAA